MVGGDEVHQPEIEHLHVGQRRQFPGVVERAVRLHEDVDGDLAVHARLPRALAHVRDHLRALARLRALRQREVGHAVRGLADDDVDVRAPVVVGVVVDADAGHVVPVGLAGLHARGHVRVIALLARGRAVLEVHGDVEDAAHLMLELEGLLDALLRAREVLAGGDDGHRRFALEERLVRMSGHETPP